MYLLLKHMEAKVLEEIQKDFIRQQEMLINYHNPHLKKKAPPPPVSTQSAAPPSASHWASGTTADGQAPPSRSYPGGSTLRSPTIPSTTPAPSSTANDNNSNDIRAASQRREERPVSGFVGSIQRVDSPSEAESNNKADRSEYRSQRRAGKYDTEKTDRSSAKANEAAQVPGISGAVSIEHFTAPTDDTSNQTKSIKIKRRNADEEAITDDEDMQSVSSQRRIERDPDLKDARDPGDGASDSQYNNPMDPSLWESPSRSIVSRDPSSWGTPAGGGPTSIRISWEPPFRLVEPGSSDRAEWDAIDAVKGLLPPDLQPLKTTRIHDSSVVPSGMPATPTRPRFKSNHAFIVFPVSGDHWIGRCRANELPDRQSPDEANRACEKARDARPHLRSEQCDHANAYLF